jgi:sialate O-acetylesterase
LQGFIGFFVYFCNNEHTFSLTMRQKLTIVMVMLLSMATGQAKVQLPQLFQNGMVLQRGTEIPVWGWADADESVAVSFADEKGKVLSSAKATADAEGRWQVSLPKNKKIKAGGPYRLEVKSEASEAIVLTDVLIGDVWLCSGQSNIDVTIERVYPNYTDEIDHFSLDKVRLFRVQNETSTHGVKNDIRPTSINWKPLTKENAWLFSAVGSFLGKRMFETTGVPQGIIVNSWGGTPIEAWVSADSLRHDYPLLVKKTEFFESDDYVRAQQRANMLANQQWMKMLNEQDPGMKEDWTSATYDDAAWPIVTQYASDWARVDGHPVIGSLWLRQHVHIDKAHAGKPARLLLGTLFDSDVTYVNGRQVGTTGYQYPPRRYDLPEGLLREGDNVITVRFINKYGMVHFIKEKPYLLAFGDDRFSQNPMPKDVIPLSEQWRAHLGTEMPNCPGGDVSLQNQPTTLYNAVLYPLAPFALSGVVWYQGESNTGNARDYAPMLRKLMGGWRDRWQNPSLPFVIVQLANHMEPSAQPQNTGWSQVREAQRIVAKEDARAELATAIDLGETVDIHPLRKKELAERIGSCFDRLVYGKKVVLSPEVIKTETDHKTITLTLDQELRPSDDLKYFEVAGADGKFQNASARTQGNQIIITSPVDQPRRVRYAWKNNPLDVNVYNQQGWPLAPMETEL